MSPTTLPHRPRLTDRALARRHLGDDDVVVLHDQASGRVTRILPVQWQVIALADGTRDLEGVVLAARARGIETSLDDLREFLEYLAEAGLLVEGPTGPIPEVDDPDADLLEVPLDPIIGWTFTCSGRGVCCEIFPTVLFTPLEANRALVALPDEPHDFCPKNGIPRDNGALAPILVSGRCRYLADDRGCSLHTRAGLDYKPEGCRAFPMQLVYDGERIRAAFAFECACVVDGIGDAGGTPPIPLTARLLGDLRRPSRVGRLPKRILLDDGSVAERVEVRTFYRALAAANTPPDVAAGLWSAGDVMRDRGIAHAAEAYSSSALTDGSPLAMLGSLCDRVRAWREPLASFRAADDLTRRALEWIVDAAEVIDHTGLPPPPSPGSREARTEGFYVKSTAWTYRDALGDLPLVTAFRVRALRVWLARTLRASPPDDPRCAEPLTLVEAMFRAHGLDASAHDNVI